MITPQWCQMMAQYNQWQNKGLYAEADAMDEAARRADRGAFFGSIHGTLSHLLWGDSLWMSRFDNWDAPTIKMKDTPDFVPDWQDLKTRRVQADARILDWTARLTPQDLDGDYSWFSGSAGREVSRPLALVVTHFFNHQTHHRGQIHAMLTAAGARPGDTDLFFMPASE